MITRQFITELRKQRNKAEYVLNRHLENVYRSDELKLQIELMNMLIQAYGAPAYMAPVEIRIKKKTCRI